MKKINPLFYCLLVITLASFGCSEDEENLKPTLSLGVTILNTMTWSQESPTFQPETGVLVKLYISENGTLSKTPLHTATTNEDGTVSFYGLDTMRYIIDTLKVIG